jgi:hypothetical protein
MPNLYFIIVLLSMFINVDAQWSYLGLGGKPTTALTINSDTLYKKH